MGIVHIVLILFVGAFCTLVCYSALVVDKESYSSKKKQERKESSLLQFQKDAE